MTDRKDLSGEELDPFFDAARAERPVPDIDLTGRILADAAVIGADYRAEPAPAPIRRGSDWIDWLSRGFGLAVPMLGCLALGLFVGLNGVADTAILSGLDAIGGGDLTVSLGYAMDGMELIGSEPGL